MVHVLGGVQRVLARCTFEIQFQSWHFPLLHCTISLQSSARLKVFSKGLKSKWTEWIILKRAFALPHSSSRLSEKVFLPFWEREAEKGFDSFIQFIGTVYCIEQWMTGGVRGLWAHCPFMIRNGARGVRDRNGRLFKCVYGGSVSLHIGAYYEMVKMRVERDDTIG